MERIADTLASINGALRSGWTLTAALALTCSFGSGCQEVASLDPRGWIVWFHADPAGATGRPYADGDIAVFTTAEDTRVVALDAQTGALRWQRRLPRPSGTAFPMPPAGNVVAFQDLIIVPAFDVYALDRQTGQVRWSFTRDDDFPGWREATVAEGRVYASGHYLYALGAGTGALHWRADLADEEPFRPVVAAGVIYVATRRLLEETNVLGDGHAAALDAASGTVLWKFPIHDPDQNSRLGGSVGPPVVVGPWLVIAGERGEVYALDRATGEPRWVYSGSPTYEACAVVEGTVIVAGDDGVVEGIDVQTGELRWRTPPGSSVSRPITVGDRVALVTAGRVHAYDADGNLRWAHGGAGYGEPVYSTAAAYHDGIVYVGSVGPEGPGPGFYAIDVP